MSVAAYKMMHWRTGIENCASEFISHSLAGFVSRMHPIQTDDMESNWPPTRREIGPIPDLVVTAGNVLEVYVVRLQEEDGARGSRASGEPKRGGLMDGVSGASLELVCHYSWIAECTVMCNGGGIIWQRRRWLQKKRFYCLNHGRKNR
ncbi:hypothetical protein ACFX11_041958 [Malus domestica]